MAFARKPDSDPPGQKVAGGRIGNTVLTLFYSLTRKRSMSATPLPAVPMARRSSQYQIHAVVKTG
jgi:hypothetical protein